MKLEKGYSNKELNAFMMQAFREKKYPRRTADGGWVAVDMSPVFLCDDEIVTLDSISDDSAFVEVGELCEIVPERGGAWKRLMSVFMRRKE
jgi:hypothetical protein